MPHTQKITRFSSAVRLFIRNSIILWILIVSFFACNRKNLWENEYNVTFGEVRMMSVTAPASPSIGTLTLNWENPEDVNVSSIQIEYISGTIDVTGVQTYTLTVPAYARYCFTIRVVDLRGITSTGITFYITWKGTALNAYFIYSAQDLNDVRGATNTYTGLPFTLADQYNLMANIDLTAAGYTNWDPIADNSTLTDTSRFTGIFEGNNHTISNMTVNWPSFDWGGLFGYISTTGIVNNLIFSDPSVSGRYYAGALAGRSDGTIEGCSVTKPGTSSKIIHADYDYAGGLVGYNAGNITDSHTTNITVTGNTYVGGLIGNNDGDLDSCYATGITVTGSALNIGGLVGRNNAATISGCYSTNGTVGGDSSVGGLVGSTIAGSTISSGSYSTVNVTGTGQAGGLVGYNLGNISDSYATGNVGNGNNIGGLVGINGGSISIVSGSTYASGNVSGNSNIGGLIGDNGGSVTGVSGNLCRATGNVTGVSFTGGLAGRNSDSITYSAYVPAITGPTVTNVHGSTNTGGLIGYNSGVITSCNSAGLIQATSNTGGLVGWSDSGGGVNTSTADVTISVNTAYADNIGGLIGRCNCVITTSSSTGDISVTLTAMSGSTNIGGLVGFTDRAITDSHSAVGIVADLTMLDDGSVTGEVQGNIGGLVGHVFAAVNINGSSTDNTNMISAEMTGRTTTGDDFLNTGGLIGRNYSATIVSGSYASVNVTVINADNVEYVNTGGLVGYTNSSSAITLSGLYATGVVQGSDGINWSATGGLFGYVISNITISSCNYTTGTVSNNSLYTAYTGGLAGCIGSGVDISLSYSTGAVSGFGTGSNTGGFIGQNNATIELSFSNGNVNGTSNVGGFVGHNATSSSLIQNCYARGYANGISNIGGFAGFMDNGTIQYCYATGAVSNSSNYGGFLGWKAIGGTVDDNCFFDNNTTGCDDTGTDGNTYGTGVSDAAMMLVATFTTITSPWDFQGTLNLDTGTNDYWDIDAAAPFINNHYPFLVGNHLP